jgi:hypothetical protein
MFAVERIGLAAGIITPVIVLAQLEEHHRALGSPPVHMRFDIDARATLAKQAYLSNNLGAHTLSCTVPSADFLRGMDAAYAGFARVVTQSSGPADEPGMPQQPASSPVSSKMHLVAPSVISRKLEKWPMASVVSRPNSSMTEEEAAAMIAGLGAAKSGAARARRSGGRRCESLSSLEHFQHFQRKGWT